MKVSRFIVSMIPTKFINKQEGIRHSLFNLKLIPDQNKKFEQINHSY